MPTQGWGLFTRYPLARASMCQGRLPVQVAAAQTPYAGASPCSGRIATFPSCIAAGVGQHPEQASQVGSETLQDQRDKQ
jgi:hypothetical protein